MNTRMKCQMNWMGAAVVCLMATGAWAQTGYNQITSVSPNEAAQGTVNLAVTFTLDTDMPPAPPAAVLPDSVLIGGRSGGAVTHDSQYVITAVFAVPSGEPAGAKDVSITFTTPQGSTLVFSMSGGFTVTEGSQMPPVIVVQPQSQAVATGEAATFSVEAWGTEPLSYQWCQEGEEIPDANDSSFTIDSVAQSDEGDYTCEIANDYGAVISDSATLTMITTPPLAGYNLFAPMMSTETYLMDNDGHPVHSWSSSYPPGLSAYFLEDGTLLRSANTGGAAFNVGGAGGRVEQYDWQGNPVWHYDYSGTEHRQHHDIEMLPNGNVLLIAWEAKTQAEAIAAGRDPSLIGQGELWPDHLVEVEPAGDGGGTIVWEWHVWDHLIQEYDAGKDNYGVVADHPEKIDLNFVMNTDADWTHINSVDYNGALDQIVLSVHNFGEIWVIDHSTTTAEAAGGIGGTGGKGGDLLYRWGNPQAYDRGAAGDQRLFAQHDAEWIESGLPGEGDLLIFNNGAGRPGGGYSSVDQITPPATPGGYTLETGQAYGPAAPHWTYTATPPADFFAQRISGAQRLANGDTLICDGPAGRFFEVTAEGTQVWQYEYEGGDEVFRVERYGPDYAGFIGTELEPELLPVRNYPVVDTGQVLCYDNDAEIAAPAVNDAFYGQDAQVRGHQPSYTLGGDGKTVYDNVTGLTWIRTADRNGDGEIDVEDKLTYTEALAYPDGLNAQNYGGYNDWRLPTIKQLYSLMNFSGTDPSGPDTSGAIPFIDTDYFGFGYGDEDAGERMIDAQCATSTLYESTTMGGNETMFGLNLADGRIKGYPTNKHFYVYWVRGNTDYGINHFVDNGDGTVSDQATGLMWSRDDCGPVDGTGPRSGMNWEEALAWVQAKNAESHLGYNDWRLPNAKEMQSIVDYTRCPDEGSAAIDPIFNITQITDEAGEVDSPWYWTGTTHVNSGGGGQAGAYVCFGRALGYWQDQWEDVHGAGCQRSDPKSGDLSTMTGYTYEPDGYYFGQAPQGDAARIDNYVRLVRDARCGEPGYVSGLDGDVNDDCYVNMLDYAEITQGWPSRYDMSELAFMAQHWLECVDPDAPCNDLP